MPTVEEPAREDMLEAVKASLDAILSALGGVPSGGPTAALQTAGNASLASIDGKVPAKGSAAMAASTPVTLATDDTLAAAMKADLDKIPSKGTAAMTGATPVTLASDDTLATAIKNAVQGGTKQNTGSFKATDVVVAAAATLLDFTFVYKGAGSEWLMLFDATSKPADTAVPSIPPIQLQVGSTIRFSGSYTPGPAGQKWTNGICWAISSAEATLTYSSGSTSLWAVATYQ